MNKLSIILTRLINEDARIKGNDTALARMIGIPQSTINRMKKGEIKNPKAENLQPIADFFGITLAQLRGEDESPRRDCINSESVAHTIRSVPLITLEQASDWANIINNAHKDTSCSYVQTTAKTSRKAFAVKVKGDSMTNPAGTPSLPSGSVIIVDPDKICLNEHIVVVKLTQDSESIIKQLIIEGGGTRQFLKSLNPAYPLIPVTLDCKIIGRAVKLEIDL